MSVLAGDHEARDVAGQLAAIGQLRRLSYEDLGLRTIANPLTSADRNVALVLLVGCGLGLFSGRGNSTRPPRHYGTFNFK